jgi:hypothetical protein
MRAEPQSAQCPFSRELCGVRVIPAVDVAVVQVKAASLRLHGGWQTAVAVFGADALGGWLVGQLADAGRKKLARRAAVCWWGSGLAEGGSQYAAGGRDLVGEPPATALVVRQ